MKNLIKYLYIIPVVLLFLSCEDEDEIRFSMDDFQDAVNFRIVSSASSFDATNPDSEVTFTMYSENEDIVKVDMFVDHFIFTLSEATERSLFKTIDGNQISNDGNSKVNFTLKDITDALGKEPADLAGGDIITVYSIVTLEDGRIYPDTVLGGTNFKTLNVTPNIINNSDKTSFSPRLQFPIVCPLEEGFATGTYKMEIVEGNNTGFGIPIFSEENVDISAVNNTTRTFEIGYLAGFGFTADVTFDFACNITLVPETSAGLSCGGPSLGWAMNTDNPGTFNIQDDSEFTISIIHNPNGGCAGPMPVGNPLVMKFTKQ